MWSREGGGGEVLLSSLGLWAVGVVGGGVREVVGGVRGGVSGGTRRKGLAVHSGLVDSRGLKVLLKHILQLVLPV